MSRRLESYALVGDCESAALVGLDGSVDWLCWPRFDSGACFAALVGTRSHGCWEIGPRVPARSSRRYRPGTLVLETEFAAPGGRARLVDCMPARESGAHFVRLLQGLEGAVPMRCRLSARFDYGAIDPWLERREDGSVTAVAGNDLVVLRADVALRIESGDIVADFELRAGDTPAFVASYGASHLPLPGAVDASRALARTEAAWQRWAAQCRPIGRWQEAALRSLLTLKALTHAPTGGIIAAPTASLPEAIGGTRNWDYRFCWLRDATFTLLALLQAGFGDEARAWRDWLVRAVAGNPAQVQPLYSVAGERRLTEWTAHWLPGYEGSRPVRFGNAACAQLQLDVYGEVLDALCQARDAGLAPSEAGWAVQRALVEHLESAWSLPDEGIWEARNGRRHFTHSKVMAWVAIDRAIRGIEAHGLPGPLARWRALREAIHADVCHNGFDAQRGTFVRSYGSRELDASLLLLPQVGFLPPRDPRVTGTVAAIERELVRDGLVLRYRTGDADDGLPPGEGAFLACSFWLADALALQGRHDEAVALFERLLALRNDVGLLAEEYDPRLGRQLGNFPQGLSHLALVGTALNLSDAPSPARARASTERGSREGGRHS